jgi:hypothetical protein
MGSLDISKIASLVTLQQVTDRSKKYLLLDKMAIIMAGDEKDIKEQQLKAAQKSL